MCTDLSFYFEAAPCFGHHTWTRHKIKKQLSGCFTDFMELIKGWFISFSCRVWPCGRQKTKCSANRLWWAGTARKPSGAENSEGTNSYWWEGFFYLKFEKYVERLEKDAPWFWFHSKHVSVDLVFCLKVPFLFAFITSQLPDTHVSL